jgi:hypothetical protein
MATFPEVPTLLRVDDRLSGQNLVFGLTGAASEQKRRVGDELATNRRAPG